MENAVILDFMGVIAEFDYVQMIFDMPLKEKFASGRLIVRLAKIHGLKNIFRKYKLGKISQDELIMLLSGNDKKLKPVISSIVEKLPKYITPNMKVVELMREIKKSGVKVIILSNTIPETEYVIKKYKLDDICDDIVCSTQVGLSKPDLKIFRYVINKNQLNIGKTIYIDDSKKNLEAGNKLGIETYHVKSTQETVDLLDNYKYYIDFLKSCAEENIYY